MQKKNISTFKMVIVIVIVIVTTSCTTTKTIPVETIRKDTIYLSNIQYDSIYIFKDHSQDYHLNPLNHLNPSETDTLFVKDVSIEYIFRLLRDTIRIARIDSIPYEVKVIKTKEVSKPPNLFDYLCYFSFGILIGITGWKLIKFIPSRH